MDKSSVISFAIWSLILPCKTRAANLQNNSGSQAHFRGLTRLPVSQRKVRFLAAGVESRSSYPCENSTVSCCTALRDRDNLDDVSSALLTSRSLSPIPRVPRSRQVFSVVRLISADKQLKIWILVSRP